MNLYKNKFNQTIHYSVVIKRMYKCSKNGTLRAFKRFKQKYIKMNLSDSENPISLCNVVYKLRRF